MPVPHARLPLIVLALQRPPRGARIASAFRCRAMHLGETIPKPNRHRAWTRDSMLIGYARISTDDQNLQRDTLRLASCEKIYEDRMSGVKAARPSLTVAPRWRGAGDAPRMSSLSQDVAITGAGGSCSPRRPRIAFRIGISIQRKLINAHTTAAVSATRSSVTWLSGVGDACSQSQTCMTTPSTMMCER